MQRIHPSGEGPDGTPHRRPSIFRWVARLFVLLVLVIAALFYSFTQAGRVIPANHLAQVERSARSEQLVFFAGGCLRYLTMFDYPSR